VSQATEAALPRILHTIDGAMVEPVNGGACRSEA